MLTTIIAQNEKTKKHIAISIDISKISYISSLSLEKTPSSQVASFDIIIDGVEKTFSNSDEELMKTFYKNLGDSLIEYDPSIKDIRYYDVEIVSKTKQ